MARRAHLLAVAMLGVMLVLCGAGCKSGPPMQFVACQKGKECPKCQGQGTYRCAQCVGRGQVQCTGGCFRGQTNCITCSGTGKNSFDSTGKLNCTACNASGKGNCWSCNGTGFRKCGDCAGDGLVDCGTLVPVQKQKKGEAPESVQSQQPASRVTPPPAAEPIRPSTEPGSGSKAQDRARLEKLEGQDGRILEVGDGVGVFHSRKDCPKLKADSDAADRGKVSCKVTPAAVQKSRIVDSGGFFHDDTRLCDRCVE